MHNILIATILLIQPVQKTNFIIGFIEKHDHAIIIIPVQIKDKIEKVAISNIDLSKYVYEPNYKHLYINYTSFLNAIFNNNYKIERKYIPEMFYYPINSESKILKYYRVNGFSSFKNKYFQSNKYGELINKPLKFDDKNELYNLLKIMFDHKYYGSFNDYQGLYYFRKI